MSDQSTPVQPHRWRLIFEIIEVRMRFILVLVITGLFIGYWDHIKNYWDKWTRPHAASAGALPADKEFYCPMDPAVIRNSYEPNGATPNCPICGMPLSLRTKGEAAALPAGTTGRVQLSPERIQLAGVETSIVAYRPLSRQITTVGSVVLDESRLSRVVSRVAGYVEKLYVDKTYMLVAAGDPLAEIYSPEIYSTARQLVALPRDAAMVESGRRRLQLFGVDDKEIDAILASGQATPRLVIRSPHAGHVIRKNIVVGTRVEEGMTMLELADHSSVWIEAEVFEHDIAMIHQGQPIEATVEAYPHHVFHGEVSLIYPHIDTTTRTNRVRLQMANPSGELRPGMFASVIIDVRLSEIEPFRSNVVANGSIKVAQPASDVPAAGGKAAIEEVLSLPRSAVIDTGSTQVVYIERQPGLFEGVQVTLGPPCGDYYPVVRGVKEGDRVAAAGSFLVDAETRLNPAAASAYLGGASGPASSHTVSSTSQANAAKLAEAPKRPSGKALENLDKLSPADRALAWAQGTCPITGTALGTMGVPLKLIVEGQPVFVCCAGCTSAVMNNGRETLENVARIKKALAEAEESKGNNHD